MSGPVVDDRDRFDRTGRGRTGQVWREFRVHSSGERGRLPVKLGHFIHRLRLSGRPRVRRPFSRQGENQVKKEEMRRYLQLE